MPTRYGRSPWTDQFPTSRVPSYPTHRGSLEVDVAIVGGGLTGCATAYAFAAAGVRVALFEASRLGKGASGVSPGWMADDPGVSFPAVERLIGLKAARHAFQTWRRAALDFAALVRRLDLKCHLEPRPSLLVALTPEQATELKHEKKSRRDAGLDVSLVNHKVLADEAGIEATAALRARDGATIDPYRATLGLAAAAAERGARIFEQSPVKSITFNRRDAALTTDGGSFRVAQVVVATAMPTKQLFGSLARHFWFKTRYLVLTDPVPARIRARLGTTGIVVRDLASPAHTIRWVGEDRLLIAGADGDTPPARLREKTIVQRTGQLMYELSTLHPDISGIMPAYGWDSPYALTAEGLPYIGAHRNFPHQVLCFGDSSHGVTGAYLASRIALRCYLEEADAADEAFGFTR
jgi:glycine/D-amino acid oxidase-like deaminating enzyme